MEDLTTKKRLSRNDLEMLKTMKTLRRKTTTNEKRNIIMTELTTTPDDMGKIINTWATIRATNPKKITPQDNRLFNMLKSKYIKLLQTNTKLTPRKPFRNIPFEKKFRHLFNKNETKHSSKKLKNQEIVLSYLKGLEKLDKEQYKKLLLKILASNDKQ